jgi:hypothetical protein
MNKSDGQSLQPFTSPSSHDPFSSLFVIDYIFVPLKLALFRILVRFVQYSLTPSLFLGVCMRLLCYMLLTYATIFGRISSI